ncbi:MAG TPA: hypothetical protein DDX07_04905 [Porphyromonadaceae bacterium]|nr:hypothetical protein [Porphyromonadaceae bacterium]
MNRHWVINDMEVISLLSKADRFLGQLDMYSEYVNVDLFIAETASTRGGERIFIYCNIMTSDLYF